MKKNSLTVIFMKDTNRPLTLQIPIKLIILLVVMLVGLASTYAFFIRGYFSLYRDNDKLELSIRTLKSEISGLQNKISEMERQVEVPIQPPETEKPAEEIAQKPSSKELVAVNNLELEPDKIAGKLKFSFFLNNTTEDSRAIRGYVFVAVKDPDRPDYCESYPPSAFKNGSPVNFRQGDPYTIKRFKLYGGTLGMDTKAKIAEILVYSDVGDLLLRISRPL